MPGKSKNEKLDSFDDMDISYLIDLWGRDELYAEDIHISEKLYIPLVLLSENGCIVIASADRNINADLKIREFLGLNERQMVLLKSVQGEVSINRFGERTSSYDLIESAALEIDYLQNLDDENVRSIKVNSVKVDEYTYEGVSYILEDTDKCDKAVSRKIKERIDDETLTYVYALLKYREGKLLPQDYKDSFTDDEGNTFVRKYKEKRVLGISTGLVGEKEWYQVSEIDEKIYALKTAILGFTGFHKFIVGEIIEGILYALTCGGAGLLPMLDVLSIICGDYRYKRNEYEDGIRSSNIIYLKKLKDVKMAALCMLLSAAIGFLMTRTLYMFMLERISEVLGMVFQNTEMIKGIGAGYR